MTALLEIRAIECRYGNNIVLNDLSFHVNAGALTCLLGPSGCGKTTILRAIAGFEPLTQGEIILDGKLVSKPGFMLAPERRGLGMVFQDYALFPHMTLFDNVAFGLRREDPSIQKERVEEMLDIVELPDLGERYPHELSGGQQQRIALARALAARPKLVLMDEPFSNLDVDLRERLRQKVINLLRDNKISTIVVTHDQQEAFAMSDIMGVVTQGKIMQWDTPFNLYHEPIDRFVADFIGPGTFLAGELVTPETVSTELGLLKGDRAYPESNGSKVDVLLRPDDVVVDPNSQLKAEVLNKQFKGAQIQYTLRLASGHKILSLFPSHYNYETGQQVGFRIEAEHLIVFKR